MRGHDVALTADVKEELARVEVSKTSVRAAELAAVLRFAGGLHIISGRIAIEAELDSPTIARRVTRDLGELYGVRPDVSVISPSGIRRSNQYLVRRDRRRRDPRTPDRPARRPPPSRARAAQQAHHRFARRRRRGVARRVPRTRQPHRSGPLGRARGHLPRQRDGDGARRRGRPPRHLREGPRGARRAPRGHPRRRGDQLDARAHGGHRHGAQLGGAPPAPGGARHRQPPRELRRREPAALGAGRGGRLRAGRTRHGDSSATTSPTTSSTRASCGSRTATRASTSSATMPTRP